MPVLIDTESRVGALVAAINVILAEEGQRRLTLRNIARVSGVSTSSMLHHLGNREHLLRVAAGRTVRARLAGIDSRIPWEGPAAFLPQESALALQDARAWLSWCDLGRAERWLFRTMHEARLEERALMARCLGVRVARHRLQGLVALVDGLTGAVCEPFDPLSVPVAGSILEDQVAIVRNYAGAAASAAVRSLPTISSGSSAE